MLPHSLICSDLVHCIIVLTHTYAVTIYQYIHKCVLIDLQVWCILSLCSVFKDKETPSPFVEEFPNDKDGQSSAAALPDHIYGDCTGMGMGCCCLQVTKQHNTITAHTHMLAHTYTQTLFVHCRLPSRHVTLTRPGSCMTSWQPLDLLL